ncbi:hypothetical protein BJY04DRAFT_48553 [Aspergillus karnatakaensis]|uniref:uncharacterized protein n=1 Tax=Aspergillus karnatakaensis TaxID=1810916 RepID=UPI003CCDBCED
MSRGVQYCRYAGHLTRNIWAPLPGQHHLQRNCPTSNLQPQPTPSHSAPQKYQIPMHHTNDQRHHLPRKPPQKLNTVLDGPRSAVAFSNEYS